MGLILAVIFYKLTKNWYLAKFGYLKLGSCCVIYHVHCELLALLPARGPALLLSCRIGALLRPVLKNLFVAKSDSKTPKKGDILKWKRFFRHLWYREWLVAALICFLYCPEKSLITIVESRRDITMYVKQCDCLKNCLWTTTFWTTCTSVDS
jgi:hypothetical protein